MKRFGVAFVFSTLLCGLGAIAHAQQQPGAAPPQGPRVLNNEVASQAGMPYGRYCAQCHGVAAPVVPNAPPMSTLQHMSPDAIYRALTAGPMVPMTTSMTDTEKRNVSESLSGRRLGVGDISATVMKEHSCSTNPPLKDPAAEPSWNGWSIATTNTRYAPAKVAGLSAGQVSRLKLKWVFGVPGASSLYDQPTVVGGRVYFGSDTGQIFSIDASSGCAYWAFQAESGVRGSVTVTSPKPGSPQLAFFGDIRSNVYALNASTGELVWKTRAGSHSEARISASVVFHNGRLYVPIAALEEVEGSLATYVCCSTRGAVTALDATTGKKLWETPVISEPAKVIGKNGAGTDVMGPSGGSVWNTPTIDPKRNALYVGTGNGFTGPPTKGTNAIFAMDLDTGKVKWTFQPHPHNLGVDIWHGGCQTRVPGNHPAAPAPRPTPTGGPGRTPTNYGPESCPATGWAPDWDYSAPPILTTLPDGRSLLVAGQKSGTVYALDPDHEGAVVWSQDVSRTLPGGGGDIVFGGATDGKDVYFNLRTTGGVVALDLATGTEKWYTPVTSAPAATQPGLANAPATSERGPNYASAGTTLIPGVVLSGQVNGMLRAYSAYSGDLIWQYDTQRNYEKTVDDIPATGGAIGQGGPVAVNGTLFVMSGYIGYQHGAPGNALLAFTTGEDDDKIPGQ